MNRNGNHSLTLKEARANTPPLSSDEVATWAEENQRALQESITPDVVQKILKAQVEKACGGDMAAARLVLGYAVGRPDAGMAPVNIDARKGTVNVTPTPARPGTPEKIQAMENRVRNGLPTCVPGDGPEVDLS